MLRTEKICSAQPKYALHSRNMLCTRKTAAAQRKNALHGGGFIAFHRITL
jgi:hypothetical protein